MMNISLFLVVALLFPLPDLILYPRLQRADAAGVPGARTRYYLICSAFLWLMAGVVAVALRGSQPWSGLRLGVPSPLRLAAGFALVFAYVALAMKDRRRLLRQPERLRRLMAKFPSTHALTPHTAAESKIFVLLAVTAGICEEILFRGFMLWCATTWIGLWPALLLTSVVFGIGHSYLGRQQIVRTAIGGAMFGVVTIVAASVWPAVVFHTFVDLLSGNLGYHAFQPSEPLEQVRDERLSETIGNGADGAALLVE